MNGRVNLLNLISVKVNGISSCTRRRNASLAQCLLVSKSAVKGTVTVARGWHGNRGQNYGFRREVRSIVLFVPSEPRDLFHA